MLVVSLIIKFNQETNVLYIILIAAFRLNTCLVHLHVPTDHLSVTYLFIFQFYSVTCGQLIKNMLCPYKSTVYTAMGVNFVRKGQTFLQGGILFKILMAR